jgi:carbamoyl-phosphate synthase small subunit
MRRNPTEPEKRLWRALSNGQANGHKFRRQAVIGRYIADFVCPQKALIVEVDGDTHDEAKDRLRDDVLAGLGFRVLRVSNHDVMAKLEGVFDAVVIALAQASDRWERPHPNPSPEGEGLEKRPHVVAIDYGSKRNIFRNLVAAGADVSVVPATASFDEVMALAPDGIFLSNGPGDPAATGFYAVPVIQQLLDTGLPLFGICLGHQLLALAVGATTTKMFQGHRGANHPVQRLSDGAVEITSMNHGFAVERDSLPATARETHVSLFDGSNAGIELTDRPAFSVQYHPEASPGPQDSLYLFEKFVGMLV